MRTLYKSLFGQSKWFLPSFISLPRDPSCCPRERRRKERRLFVLRTPLSTCCRCQGNLFVLFTRWSGCNAPRISLQPRGRKGTRKIPKDFFSGLHAPWRPRAEKEICFFGYWNTIYISLAFHGRERVTLEPLGKGYRRLRSWGFRFVCFYSLPSEKNGISPFCALGASPEFPQWFFDGKVKRELG